MADFTVTGDTKLDSSGINHGVNTIKRTMAGFGKAALIAGAAAGTAFLTAGKAGVTYNAQMEQYTTSFEVMTGNAAKSAQIMIDLKAKAASTPFELSDLASTTQLLMNYGLTADDAMGKMSMLGDIAQGNAEKMNRISTAYGQMSSAGKVSLEDIKQMIESGFNPLQEISANTGESMASLYERISKGAISVDEITASMERSTSAGGRYYQSMDKQALTLTGRLSTLKDTISGKLGEAFQSLNDILRDKIIPAVTDFIEKIDIAKIIENFKHLIAKLQELLPALAAATTVFLAFKTAALINDVIKSFGKGREAIELFTMSQVGANLAQGIMNGSLSVFNGIVALMTGKVTLAQLATAAWTTIQGALNASFLACPITWIVVAIAALVAAFLYLWNTCEPFKQFWLDLWDGIKSAIAAAGVWISGCIDSICAFFAVQIPAAIQTVQTWFANLWQTISEFFTVQIPQFVESVIQWFMQLPENIAFFIGQIIGYIILFAQKLWEFLTVTIPQFITGVVQWFSQLPGQIWTWLCNTINNIATWAADMIARGTQAASAFLSHVVQWFSQLPGNVWTWLCNTITKVISFAKDMAVKASDAAKGFVENLIDGVRSLPATFMEIGGNIVSGLWNGISAGWRWLTDSVKNLANSLLSGVKSVLDINSPSKKFAWVGKMSAVGLEKGFVESDPIAAIKKSVSMQMEKINGAFNLRAKDGKIPAGQTIIQNDNSINPIFNQPMQAPDEIARALRLSARRELAGAR